MCEDVLRVLAFASLSEVIEPTGAWNETRLTQLRPVYVKGIKPGVVIIG